MTLRPLQRVGAWAGASAAAASVVSVLVPVEFGNSTAASVAASVATAVCASTGFIAALGDRLRLLQRGRNTWAGWRGRRASAGSREGLEALAVMRLAARVMPPAARRRWLGEAESFLYEAAPELRRRAGRSYLRTAPQVITAAWAAELARGSRALIRRRRV